MLVNNCSCCLDIKSAMYCDEKNERFIAEVELPGIQRRDIHLEAGEEGFCIKAKRKEIEYDSCFRSFEHIDPNKMRARFRGQVLHLEAPLSKKSLHTCAVKVS